MTLLGQSVMEAFSKKHARSRKPLANFAAKVENAVWSSLVDIRNTFNSADYYSDDRYIFNVGGNKYRLVAHIQFELEVLTVERVMTHAEYDEME